MSIIIPKYQALNFDVKIDSKCCGNSDFCQIYENTDSPCVQVQLTGNGTDLICQGDFVNFMIDGDFGTFETNIFDGFVVGAGMDTAVVGTSDAHTGTHCVEGLLTGVTGIILNNTTNVTLIAGRKYWLKAWIKLDGWSIGGGDDTVFDIGINCGWVTATTAVIKQVDNTNGVADTWLEMITEITVAVTSAGCMQVRVAGHPIDNSPIFLDDFGVTCWEIIEGFKHDWINETLSLPTITDGDVRQIIAINPCSFYKISYEFGGTVILNCTIVIRLGGNEIIHDILSDTPNPYTRTFYMMSGDSDSYLEFLVYNSASSNYLDNISVEEFSMPAYCLENCSTDEKICSQYQCDGGYAYAGNDITIYEDDLGNLWALICPDLTGLNGCYKICIYDILESFYGEEMVCNGTFSDDTCWTLFGTNAPTIISGVLRFNVGLGLVGAAVIQDGILGVDFILQGGCKYTLEFDILNYVKGQLIVYIENITHAPYTILLGSWNADGHYSVEIDLSAYSHDYIVLQFQNIIPNLTGMQMDVDNVSVKAIEYCGEEPTPIACTECLCITDEHPCSLLLSWTNDENAFGFEYEVSGFMQSLRVKANLFNPNYKKDKEVFRFSNGEREILYSDTTKIKKLTIGDMPEYLHDALSIGIEHDYFWIDGVRYVTEDEDYSPKWRPSALIASVEFEVIEADQNLQNNNC